MTSLQIALCDDNSLSLQLAQLAIQEYERQHADRSAGQNRIEKI